MFEPIFLGLLLGVPLSVQIALTFGKQNMVCFQKKTTVQAEKHHQHSRPFSIVIALVMLLCSMGTPQ